MDIVKIGRTDAGKIAPLIADFRVTLDSFRAVETAPDLNSAEKEINEFLEKGFPVFAAMENDEYIGYIVCRTEEPCLWVEQIFVREDHRRKGAASMLFGRAEEIAHDMGEETVFNYVHPNNNSMIQFLRSKGYTVLNLIEIRKPYKDERLTTVIHVDDNTFDY